MLLIKSTSIDVILDYYIIKKGPELFILYYKITQIEALILILTVLIRNFWRETEELKIYRQGDDFVRVIF